MSFIPNNQARLDAEVAREREHELREGAERYAATHPDPGPSPEGGPRGLGHRLRALLSRGSRQ